MTREELRDRAEITELLYRYARAIDTRELESLAQVFTPDARIDYALERGASLPFAQMTEWLRRSLAIFKRTQHVVTNPLIELDGDEARSTCYLFASHVQVPLEGGERLVAEGGIYSDRHVRTAAGWRIRERTLRRIWVNGRYLGPDQVRLFEKPELD